LDFASQKPGSGAAVGLNVGSQYVYTFYKGIGVFGGIDFNYNGLEKDYKDKSKELYEAAGINIIDINFSKFINVPITAGLSYKFEAGNKIGVFAKAGLSFNFLKMTDFELKADTIAASYTVEYDIANDFGFKLGVGILINHKISVSLDYLDLGKHNINGEMKMTGYPDYPFDFNVKVDLLTLTVGYNF
jgi:hypothetical protein